jgi:methoxymalonate biosynthesis protein
MVGQFVKPGDSGLAAVREFVDQELMPYAGEYDESGKLPEQLLQRVSELGLWAPFLPAEVGGRDMDMVTLGKVHEEVGRACSSTRSLLTVHTMVSWSVLHYGTDEQRRRWLPELADGSTLGSFCLTGTEDGSGTSAVGTSAALGEDGWTINGRKKWITGGQTADLLLVFAGTKNGMTSFLVPANTPGIQIEPISGVLGTRASMMAEIVFTDVKVGTDALLGPVGWAAGTVMTSALDLGRYSVASGCVGIIQGCLDACVTYATERPSMNGVLFDHQLVRRMITEMIASVRAARLLCEEAGRLKDTGDPGTIMASWVAKYFASTAAARCAADAVQIHGANGCAPGHPVNRYYRDSKVMEIIEGPTELQQTTIAEQAYREVTR